MAQSPFQTSGNVADIAPVQLKGGFTPDTGIADAVVDVANTVIPVIRQNLEDDLTDDVTGRAAAVSLALKATRFPSIQTSIFSEEALANPNVAMALEEFTLIQDATQQGRLPSTFALERLELIQNNAIRNAPEFESEIRGAMRDATGQDPQKALFGRLLQETSSKTAEQKAFEQLDVEAIKLGISRDQLIGINQAASLNSIEQSKFDLAAKQGTYTINTLGSEVVNRGAVLVTDVMADVQRMATAGQAIGVEEKQALTAKVNAAFGAATSAILAKTAGLNVSGTAVNAELAPLNALRDNTLRMIEDDTLQTVLSQHNDTIIASTQASLLNNPDYVAAYAIGGSRGFLDLVKFMGKSSGSSEGKALTAALSTDAKIAFDLQNLPSQYAKIGSPDQLETRKEKQDRVIASGVALSTSEIDENFQIAALEDIKKYGGEELAWSSFGSNNVLTATAKSNKLKAAFINMQATTTAGLSQELVEIASNPNVQLDKLVLSQEGVLTFDVNVADRGITGIQLQAIADTQAFVKRFNRANNISAKYNGAGILPTARYQGSAAYWGTVREAAESIVQPRGDDEVKVIRFVRDDNGNIVPEGE